jgi:hypothetical protein
VTATNAITRVTEAGKNVATCCRIYGNPEELRPYSRKLPQEIPTVR